MIHSLKKFHHYVRVSFLSLLDLKQIVATSCLFFACKVEEQPRRLREFIDIVQSLFHKSNEPINHNSEVSPPQPHPIFFACLFSTPVSHQSRSINIMEIK